MTLSNTRHAGHRKRLRHGAIALNSAQASISGGGQTVLFSGTGDAVTLSNTAGTQDTVSGYGRRDHPQQRPGLDLRRRATGAFLRLGRCGDAFGHGQQLGFCEGAGGTINLNGAQTSVAGGGDTVNFLGSSGNAASLYNTAGNWDYINGSGGTVYLTNAQTSVAGGGDTVNFLGSSGNAASLYNTAGNWDYINGSGGTVYLTNAQTSVAGGGDTINFLGSSGNAASLYNTAGAGVDRALGRDPCVRRRGRPDDRGHRGYPTHSRLVGRYAAADEHATQGTREETPSPRRRRIRPE